MSTTVFEDPLRNYIVLTTVRKERLGQRYCASLARNPQYVVLCVHAQYLFICKSYVINQQNSYLPSAKFPLPTLRIRVTLNTLDVLSSKYNWGLRVTTMSRLSATMDTTTQAHHNATHATGSATTW